MFSPLAAAAVTGLPSFPAPTAAVHAGRGTNHGYENAADARSDRDDQPTSFLWKRQGSTDLNIRYYEDILGICRCSYYCWCVSCVSVLEIILAVVELYSKMKMS